MKDLTYRQAEAHFLAYCRTKSLSPYTIGFYEDRLEDVRKYLEETHPGITPSNTTVQQFREYIVYRRQRLSAKTLNHTVRTLKTMFGFLVREGYLIENPTERLDRLREPKRLIRTFSPDQIRTLLSLPDKTKFSGVRDYVMLIVMLDTGVRLRELVNMSIRDIDWQEGTIRVVGKGNKERMVAFGTCVRKALREYLVRRGDSPDTSLLFVNEYGEPISVRTVQDAIRDYGLMGRIAV